MHYSGDSVLAIFCKNYADYFVIKRLILCLSRVLDVTAPNYGREPFLITRLPNVFHSLHVIAEMLPNNYDAVGFFQVLTASPFIIIF
jgi:hypothetical protein